MKKNFVLLILIFLVGCNQKFINLQGESKQWRINYRLDPVNDGTDELYQIIKKEKNMEINEIHIDINGGERTYTSAGNDLMLELAKDNKFDFQNQCADCSVNYSSKEVIIEWDGNKETIKLSDSN